MKKKIIAVIVTATLLIAGCDNINVSEDHGEKLMLVENSGGGITVMLNADGTPKIWQGEE